jgi:N-acetyl-1-D-myo-inositol-2-amino-2-deoxy-alpha-D-glucopyranoside deacetylase
VDDLPGVLSDEEITAVLDGREHLSGKVAALRAHRSQVDLDGGFFAIISTIPEFAMESYLLVRGERGPGSGPYGWEGDLFAGLGGQGSGGPSLGGTE